MRLIDADALIEALLEVRHEETETMLKLVRFINNRPTIEIDQIVYDYLTKNNITEIHNHRTGQVFQIIRHGRWIVKGQDIYCSECDNESAYNPFGASKFSLYCPNCGAKMGDDE